MRRLVLFSDMYFGSPTLERSRFSCARLRRPNLRRRLGEWAGMAGACAGARDVVVGWRGFFGRHCVPSAASRLSLMDFFVYPIVLKHTRLINRILRKVLLANLGPVRRFEVGPRAVVQGVNKFLPSTVTLLVPWKRGEIQVRIFYDIPRTASNYTWPRHFHISRVKPVKWNFSTFMDKAQARTVHVQLTWTHTNTHVHDWVSNVSQNDVTGVTCI